MIFQLIILKKLRNKYMAEKNIIEMKDIIKRYYIGMPNELQILNGISISVKEGEFV